MPRSPIDDRSAAFDLQDALARRLERRLRQIERLDAPLLRERDPESSLQALAERITRLQVQAELLGWSRP